MESRKAARGSRPTWVLGTVERLGTRLELYAQLNVYRLVVVYRTPWARNAGLQCVDADTARHGLAHAAFTLIEMHRREVSAAGQQRNQKGSLGDRADQGSCFSTLSLVGVPC